MKIKSFYTEQFAGLRTDKPIEFADGMNVVLGHNEAGKSTMISAMFHVLNKPVKLNLKTDKEFIATVFPTGGEDTIDGTISVQEGGQSYTIKKIWDRTGDATAADFKPENSGLLRGEKAEEALKKVVRFGPGVYSNLIFGRQNNEAEILDWCYRFFSSRVSDDVEETRRKIAEAFSAAGGVSPDKFLDLVNCYLEGDPKRKIKGLAGNWDFARDLPRKHTKNKRWEKGNGSILDAYYEYEDAKAERDTASNTEKEIVKKTEKIAELLREKSELESERDDLVKQSGAISDREHIETLWKDATKKKEAVEKAMRLWPQEETTMAALSKLKAAKEEKTKREAKEELSQLIGQIRELERANQEIQNELDQTAGYEKAESEARTLSRRIGEINGMLTAAKLRAAVAMEPGYKAVLTFSDGTEREICGTEMIDADGFVRLNIPGVGSVQVYPQELDVEGLERERKEKEQQYFGILGKYGSDTLEKFEERIQELKDKNLSMKGNETVIRKLLKGTSIEEYEKKRDQIDVDDSVSIPDSLENDIRYLLEKSGKSSLEELQGSLETVIGGYKEEFGSQDKLPQKFSEFAEKEREYFGRLQKYQDTPCLSVEEYEKKVKDLNCRVNEIDGDVGERRTEIGTLLTREVTDIAGLEARVEEAEEKWLHEKKKYEYYMRIKKSFEDLRAGEENQFGEFYSKFNEYLGMITNQRISLKLTRDKLCLQSSSQEVDSSDLLSEGTKKTVLLAFRLAVLEYFFPEGDGLVVLDDTLLDMDPARREQAAKLLNRFSKDNQVIFTTCDPAIAELLGGNLISMRDCQERRL